MTDTNDLIEQVRKEVTESRFRSFRELDVLLTEAADRLASQQSELSALRQQAEALVAKLDECKPYIDSAFFQMANHGMPHTGPQYGVELETLRSALQSYRSQNND